jgi:hypothetical protein
VLTEGRPNPLLATCEEMQELSRGDFWAPVDATRAEPGPWQPTPPSNPRQSLSSGHSLPHRLETERSPLETPTCANTR